MSLSDCSAFRNNAGCTGVLCISNWRALSPGLTQTLRDTWCKPIGDTGCGACTNTTFGGACCQRNDYVSCFADLASQRCAGGGASGSGSGPGSNSGSGAGSNSAMLTASATSVLASATAAATSAASGTQTMSGSSTASTAATPSGMRSAGVMLRVDSVASAATVTVSVLGIFSQLII